MRSLPARATSEPRCADKTASTDGDRFTHGGVVFEVVQVADWSAAGGYWRAVAARVEV